MRTPFWGNPWKRGTTTPNNIRTILGGTCMGVHGYGYCRAFLIYPCTPTRMTQCCLTSLVWWWTLDPGSTVEQCPQASHPWTRSALSIFFWQRPDLHDRKMSEKPSSQAGTHTTNPPEPMDHADQRPLSLSLSLSLSFSQVSTQAWNIRDRLRSQMCSNIFGRVNVRWLCAVA